MSIIITCITIVFIKTAWSQSTSWTPTEKVCVSGAPMGNVYPGLQGEYTIVEQDPYPPYYIMQQPTNCNDLLSDTTYIHYSFDSNRWEISPSLDGDDYYFACDWDAWSPSECGNGHWIGKDGWVRQNFYINADECPIKSDTKHMTVGSENGPAQDPDKPDGCYHFFNNEGNNLWIGGQSYPKVNGSGKTTFYWLYSITYQKWICTEEEDLEDRMDDYDVGCYYWPLKDLSDGFHRNYFNQGD